MATGLLLSGTIAALLTSVLPAQQHQSSGGFEDPRRTRSSSRSPP